MANIASRRKIRLNEARYRNSTIFLKPTLKFMWLLRRQCVGPVCGPAIVRDLISGDDRGLYFCTLFVAFNYYRLIPGLVVEICRRDEYSRKIANGFISNLPPGLSALLHRTRSALNSCIWSSVFRFIPVWQKLLILGLFKHFQLVGLTKRF